MALVQVDGKYGYIDLNGTIKISPTFMDATSFLSNMAGVRGDLKWGVIDKEGKFIVDPKYEFAIPLEDGLVRYMQEGRIGYLNSNGQIVWNAQ